MEVITVISKVGIYGSNYNDKVGIWGSNDADKVGIWGSNYSDKVGIWGSNYTFRLDCNSSNYVARINTELTTVIGLKQGTLTASTLSDFLNTTDDFIYNAGTTKIDLSKNTSNYVARINTELTTTIAPLTNYWTKDAGTNIYLNQTGNRTSYELLDEGRRN
jgi:hypothetical protein